MDSFVNLVIIITLFIVATLAFGKETKESHLCNFRKHKSEHPFQKKLEPLLGNTYSVKDATQSYEYYVGICADPLPPTTLQNEKYKNAGVVQQTLDAKKQGTEDYHIIGQYTEAEIMGGKNWIMLEYEKGENYGSHCKNEGRRANIMIICDPTEQEGRLRMVEENNNKTEDCYYLFELDHQAACTSTEPRVYGLSVGSILIILMFVFAALYLVLGFLYLRFVAHARGIEQIPNWSFWQDFGNLQADGCNFICRCGKSPSYSSPRPSTYRGVGDDQLEDEEGNDDHLLPM